jgi:hypothetical protein
MNEVDSPVAEERVGAYWCVVYRAPEDGLDVLVYRVDSRSQRLLLTACVAAGRWRAPTPGVRRATGQWRGVVGVIPPEVERWIQRKSFT